MEENIKYKVAQGYCENADANEGVRLAYSTNGGPWIHFYGMHPPYGSAPVSYSAPIPSAARTASTRIRFWQQGGCNIIVII